MVNPDTNSPVEPEKSVTPQEDSEEIFFDCPSCGQSMSINHKAAGLIVDCPGCRGKVKIPSPNPGGAAPSPSGGASDQADGQTRILLDSLSSSQRRVQEISERYNSVQRRRAFLEKMRVENLQLFKEINIHLEQIRTSCDRLADIMKDAP